MNTCSPVLREIYDRIKHEPHSAIELVPSGILLSRWHGEMLTPTPSPKGTPFTDRQVRSQS